MYLRNVTIIDLIEFRSKLLIFACVCGNKYSNNKHFLHVSLFLRSQLLNGSLYISSVAEELGLTGSYQCMASLPNGAVSIVSRSATLSLASKYQQISDYYHYYCCA